MKTKIKEQNLLEVSDTQIKECNCFDHKYHSDCGGSCLCQPQEPKEHLDTQEKPFTSASKSTSKPQEPKECGCEAQEQGIKHTTDAHGKPQPLEWEEDLQFILTEWEGGTHPILGATRISSRMKTLIPFISTLLSLERKKIATEIMMSVRKKGKRDYKTSVICSEISLDIERKLAEIDGKGK